MTDPVLPGDVHLLPDHGAWFRYIDSSQNTRLGGYQPASEHGPEWFDLGALQPEDLLAQGRLTTEDLLQRCREGQRMSPPRQMLPPVGQPQKILCVAKNYVAHAREFGAEAPPEPIFFAKVTDALVAHQEAVRIPHWLETRVDHEAELAVVLGFADSTGVGRRYVAPSSAEALVAGYTIVNDVTARRLQGDDRSKQYPWLRSKSLATFCPCGPYVVPADALDGGNLQVRMFVNGQLRQQARTSDMVFSIGEVLSAVSRCLPLRPADLVAMGTPEGVGPVVDGDSMSVAVEGLGVLTNSVRKDQPEF